MKEPEGELKTQNEQKDLGFVWMVLKISFLVILLGINIIISSASAYTVSDMSIMPHENIVVGDPIAISFSLTLTPKYYPDGKKYSADPDNTIAIVTALDNPVWVRKTVLNGAASMQTVSDGSNVLALEGWDIAYLQSSYVAVGNEEMINITLTGNAPNVTSTSTVPFLTISEHDQKGQKIKGSEQVFRQSVINGNDLASALYLAEQDLMAFNASITEKQGTGIDVSAEQLFASSAATSLGIAKQLPPEKYHDALLRLKDVGILISEGETALDRDMAEQEYDRASATLNKVDTVIEWFHMNSTMDYPGLKQVIDRQGNVSRALTSATNAMSEGQYESAREYSNEAFLAANQTYYDALIVQKRAKDPLTFFWDFDYPIIGIILFTAAAYMLFKPRKKEKKITEEKKG